MRRRLACERGLALVSAVVLMTLMTGVGLTAFAYVDVQQRESAVERMRESAFNLSEAVLSAETFLLARKWPDTPAEAFPNPTTRNCASTGVLDPQRCPDPDFLARSFGTADYASQSAWIVSVRDNGGDLPGTAKVEQDSGGFYDPADDDKVGGRGGGKDVGDDPANQADDADDTATDAQPAWDYNGDGRMWIRAQASVRTKRRTLVALVDVDEVVESFPRNVISAGWLTTGGNKHLQIKTGGSMVAIRSLGAPSKWQSSQIDGAVTQLTDGGKALSDRALDRLRQRAAAMGTYYPSGCPSSLAGELVFIESSGWPGLCGYTGNASFNCPSYGVVVVASGGISLGGTVDYCGVIYLANRDGVDGVLLKTHGTPSITGAVAVDGAGGLEVGNSSKPHLIYEEDAFGAVRSYPSGAIVPSTWREIQG